MFSRRSILAASSAGVLGMGAAACGASSSTDDTPVDLSGDAAELSGEITLLTPDFTSDARTVLDDDIIGAFTEQHPDVTVTVDAAAWDKLNEKLTASIAGGVVADVIMTGVGWTQPFAQKGLFAELPTDDVEALGFEESVLKSGLYEDGYYSIPQAMDLRFMTYHPELFEAKGITEPPKTLEELAQVATELTGDGVIGIDLLSQNIRQAWIFLLYAFGGTLFSEDGLTPALHEEPGRQATQWILDLMASGATSYDLQVAEGQPSLFQQKKVAMAITSTGNWTSWVDMTPELTEEGAIGMFLMPPGGTATEPVMYQGGTLISISKKSRNQQAAAAFAKHMLSPEMLAIGNAANGKVPPTVDIPTTPGIDGSVLARFGLDSLAYAGAAEGGTPAWMEIRGNLQPLIESCLTGKTTVDQMLADMKSLCDDAISRI